MFFISIVVSLCSHKGNYYHLPSSQTVFYFTVHNGLLCFPGERFGETAHRLIQLLHQCGGKTRPSITVCYSCLSFILISVWLSLLQIKKIMKANEKITSDADPMWYLKWVTWIIFSCFNFHSDLKCPLTDIHASAFIVGLKSRYLNVFPPDTSISTLACLMWKKAST